MDRPIGVSAYAAGRAPLPGLPSPAELAEGVTAIVASTSTDVRPLGGRGAAGR